MSTEFAFKGMTVKSREPAHVYIYIEEPDLNE
jgi:hypothetical protein